VEVNVEWVEHSTFDELNIDAGSNTAFLPASTIPANWDDNWTYGFGADYQLNENLVLRCGYIYLETPVPSETMLPSISEEDQSVVFDRLRLHLRPALKSTPPMPTASSTAAR
jgi:long-subunit fatty acid transport protein